ncbi:MAG: glycosyltransferase family 2 protein [Oscillospiraceae bacterium]
MSDKNPLISIIVPVYNVEKYLKKCLDSLVGQTMKEIEIICVNDGGPDNSLEILNEYAKNDERIIVIDKKNEGVSAARNSALKIAEGEYIMFVDSDDWIDEAMCEEMLKAIKQDDADAVMCSYIKEFSDHSVENHVFSNEYIVWNEADVKKNFHRRLFGMISEELNRPQDGDIIVSVWMQLFKVDICREIEFVDLKKIGTFEDGLFQIQAYNNCRKFVYIDKPFYHYRKTNDDSITTVYKPQLFDRWQNLYNIMEDIIDENGYGKEYKNALNNRIALGMIGLGLNEISAKGKSIFKKSKSLKQMLKTERYEKAYRQLEFKPFPFEWKVFFFLCKCKMTFALVGMLECIDYLRRKNKR